MPWPKGRPWNADDHRLRKGRGCRYGHPPERWNSKEAYCLDCQLESTKASRRYRLARVPPEIRRLLKAVASLEAALAETAQRQGVRGPGSRFGDANPKRRAKRRRA